LEYLSPFRYGYAVLVKNEVTIIYVISLTTQFTGLTFTCLPDERLANGQCRFNQGEEVINYLGFNESVARDMVILVGLFVGLRVLCWIALIWRARTTVNT
jgi:hypothetical protein